MRRASTCALKLAATPNRPMRDRHRLQPVGDGEAAVEDAQRGRAHLARPRRTPPAPALAGCALRQFAQALLHLPRLGARRQPQLQVVDARSPVRRSIVGAGRSRWRRSAARSRARRRRRRRGRAPDAPARAAADGCAAAGAVQVHHGLAHVDRTCARRHRQRRRPPAAARAPRRRRGAPAAPRRARRIEQQRCATRWRARPAPRRAAPPRACTNAGVRKAVSPAAVLARCARTGRPAAPRPASRVTESRKLATITVSATARLSAATTPLTATAALSRTRRARSTASSGSSRCATQRREPVVQQRDARPAGR